MDKSALSSRVIKNLEDLSAYLKAYTTLRTTAIKSGNLAVSDVDFDLSYFFKPESEQLDTICGTSACAVGHFAVMRGFETNLSGVTDNKLIRLSWHDFSRDILGVGPSDETEQIWDWLFSAAWVDCDNTPLGVAARIEHFLEHGVPDEFYTEDYDCVANSDQIIEMYLPCRQALELECGIAKS